MVPKLFRLCIFVMWKCNETINMAIRKFPATLDIALDDLHHHHTSTTVQLRKSLTRSLDVASEAILADLDSKCPPSIGHKRVIFVHQQFYVGVEDLLGKPVQSELASETGVEVALEALLDVANISVEFSNKADTILQRGEQMQNLATELSGEIDQIRLDLESIIRSCLGSDKFLCAVIDPNALRSGLRIDKVRPLG